MKTVLFITSTLPLIHGGRTKSLLQRARIFTENNVKVKIYTTNYNQNYEYVYKNFLKDGIVNQNIEMCNIYDYYKGEHSNQIKNYEIFLQRELKKYDFFPTNKNLKGRLDKLLKGRIEKDAVNIYKFKKVVNSHVTYFYKEGRTLYHLSKNKETDKIKNIDFYLPHYNKSVMRAYTDDNENIHKIRYFQPGTDIVQADVFVDSNFHPYVVKEYSYKNGDKKLDRVILTKKNGHTNVFKAESNFFKHWFEEVFVDGDVVINDARLLDRPLIETKRNIKKIFQIHSSHLANPLDLQSDVNERITCLFQYNFKETDTIITLTHAQKQNILEKRPTLCDYIKVIPHSVTEKDIKHRLNNKQICIVSRLVPLKNLNDTIEAFKNFSEVMDGYTLVIYGDGEEKEKLIHIIKEKMLENNVKLKGFTKNVDKVFQESIFSIMCSSHEAFALSILESIANGCPAISYDTKWGPAEILDEKSGRITKENTPEALCDAMLEEVRHPKNRDDVIERSKMFSQDAFYEAWTDVLFS